MSRVREWFAEWGQVVSVVGLVVVLVVMGFQNQASNTRFRAQAATTAVQVKAAADANTAQAHRQSCAALHVENVAIETLLFRELHADPRPQTKVFLADLNASLGQAEVTCLRG